ncbi:hypothetical protein Tco_0521849 [Tanacetum coccineum]
MQFLPPSLETYIATPYKSGLRGNTHSVTAGGSVPDVVGISTAVNSIVVHILLDRKKHLRMNPPDGQKDGSCDFKTINKFAKEGHLNLLWLSSNYPLYLWTIGKILKVKADMKVIVLGYASNKHGLIGFLNLPEQRVEETMNLRFLEDKPNVQGIGHEWYFDLDYLTDSLGYTRFKTDTPAGSQETNINAGLHQAMVLVVLLERNADYAEELAKLIEKIYEARTLAARYGYFDPAGGNPAGSFQPAGSYEPAGQGNPAVSTSVSADFIPVHADESTLPPGQSLGSSENTTRFPVPSNPAAVEVNPVPTKRVNTIHPQSQILGDLASPVPDKKQSLNKYKFGEKEMQTVIQPKIMDTCPFTLLQNAIRRQKMDFDEHEGCKRNSLLGIKLRLLQGTQTREEGLDYDEMDVKMPLSYGEKLMKKSPRAWYMLRLSCFSVTHKLQKSTIDKDNVPSRKIPGYNFGSVQVVELLWLPSSIGASMVAGCSDAVHRLGFLLVQLLMLVGILLRCGIISDDRVCCSCCLHGFLMLVEPFLLAKYILPVGVVYAVDTSIYAAELVVLAVSCFCWLLYFCW